MSGRLSVFVVLCAALACSGVQNVEWTNDEGKTLLEVTGSQEHCGWQSVSFLHFREQRYVADPEGAIDRDGVAVPYDPSVELPPGAEPTGFSEDERELWVLPGERRWVYVVTEDGAAQRWPRTDVACD